MPGKRTAGTSADVKAREIFWDSRTNKLHRYSYLRTCCEAIGHIDIIVLRDKQSPELLCAFITALDCA